MNNQTRGTGPWYNEDTKIMAVYDVLHYLMRNPREGLSRVGNDVEAKNLFEREGRITVPVNQGARVIFFAPDEGEIYEGDGRLAFGSSVIIRVPPDGVPTNLTDFELMTLCLVGTSYPYWPPGSIERFRLSKSLS